MVIRSGAELHKPNAVPDRFESQVHIPRDVPRFDEGIERREERKSDRLDLRVGVREGRFQRIDVGEKRSEVVDGEDEVLVMSLADLLDFGLLGAREVAEAVEEGLGLAGGEGLADEGSQVLAVSDGGGKEELVELVGGVAVLGRRRSDFAASFRGVHRW